jgi:uncharacterized protein (UPF0332 family)
MTEENCAKNAEAELGRAEVCLREAEVLRASGLPYGAASRAYYAVFHAARALLVSRGLEPASHRGVVSLIGEHYVRSGVLSAEQGRMVSRMQRDREDADYQVGSVFTDDQAAEAVRSAQRFIEAVRGLITSVVAD